MRSLLASLLLVPLISCGDSSSSGKSGGKNSGGSGDGESGEESVYEPDFDAISARCYEAQDASSQAKYECCVEEGDWNPYASDEEWCYDFYVDQTWGNDVEDLRTEPDHICAVSVIENNYDSIADDGYSDQCIDERLSHWAILWECSTAAYSGGCGSESAQDTARELQGECNQDFGYSVYGSDCE